MARHLKMVETGHRCPRVGGRETREGPKALRTVEEMGAIDPQNWRYRCSYRGLVEGNKRNGRRE